MLSRPHHQRKSDVLLPPTRNNHNQAYEGVSPIVPTAVGNDSSSSLSNHALSSLSVTPISLSRQASDDGGVSRRAGGAILMNSREINDELREVEHHGRKHNHHAKGPVAHIKSVLSHIPHPHPHSSTRSSKCNNGTASLKPECEDHEVEERGEGDKIEPLPHGQGYFDFQLASELDQAKSTTSIPKVLCNQRETVSSSQNDDALEQNHCHKNHKIIHNHQLLQRGKEERRQRQQHHHRHRAHPNIFQRFRPHHHHQGHLFNSAHESSSASISTGSYECFPPCACSPHQKSQPHSQLHRLDEHTTEPELKEIVTLETKEEKCQDNDNHMTERTQEQTTTHENPEAYHSHKRSLFSAVSSLARSFTSPTHHKNSLSEQSNYSLFALFDSNPNAQPVVEDNHRSSHRHTGPFLYGTTTFEQHEAKMISIIHICKLFNSGYDLDQYSQHEHLSNLSNKQTISGHCNRARSALSSIGFEFRVQLCDQCKQKNNGKSRDKSTKARCICEEGTPSNDGEPHSQLKIYNTLGGNKSEESTTKDCPDCITRLYHIPTSTFITSENRKVFIADGTMYDEFADLCQAAAQEIMAEKCNLTWVTICDGKNGGVNTRQMMENITPADTSNNSDESKVNTSDNSLEPIRALVSKQTHNNPNRKPHDTLLISTGKGKVRAGIFSRQHLLTTGLEPATCLSLLVEAQHRDMHCVVIDPNARTDREGMATFEASVRSLFDCHCELKEDEIKDGALGGDTDPSVPVDGSIFVLAHSASGEYFAEVIPGILWKCLGDSS